MMKKLTVELDKANSLINDINQIAEKYNVSPNYDGYEITVDFKELLKPKYIDVPAEKEKTICKGISSYNEIDVVMFRDAVNSLEKGKALEEKMKKAAKITDLSLQTVMGIYNYRGLFKKVYKNTGNAVKKLYDYCNLTAENKAAEEVESIARRVPSKNNRTVSSKNDIMIRRVIKSLGTDDPDAIAKKIASSTNILNQTDFSNYDDVIEYLKTKN